MMFFLANAIDIETSNVTGSDLGMTFLKMMLTFALLILLLFGTYWVLKRFIRHRMHSVNGEKEIFILEKKMLSPKTMLYLLEVNKKKILMAESQLEIKCLETFQSKTENCTDTEK